ncbi:MAG TPA: response regulator transcription factor [Solirubrobacteraceae bacterium]|nr:response regulator transcription factor [Solirubrobacteraceae bacterium]
MSLPQPHELSPELSRRGVQALVLEQHAATRIGFGLLLRSQLWVERCFLSRDRSEAVLLTERTKPDIAIVDVTDAGAFASAYIAPLRHARPVMALLLSTRERDSPARTSVLPIGAAGLITPDHSVENVVDAIRSALTEQPLPDPSGRQDRFELSAREHDVLMLLTTGATNREIAATLHVSSETVKKHAAALYRKLGVRNRTEAAQLAPEISA